MYIIYIHIYIHIIYTCICRNTRVYVRMYVCVCIVCAAQRCLHLLLQCVAACCVLQCVAVCCSVLLCVHLSGAFTCCCSVLQCVGCCIVLQCVAVCASQRCLHLLCLAAACLSRHTYTTEYRYMCAYKNQSSRANILCACI